LELAEKLGRTLAELDSTIGAHELQLWAARAEIVGLVQSRMERHRGLRAEQALDQVRADYRAYMRRKQ